MNPSIVDVTEQKRLNEAREAQIPWKKWGPYLSERQWGTVREDYSDDGNAWDYFTHDQARSRAYRWGEDGLGGICDDKQRLCFALALWNERDPILKERLFGLTNSEGNHGEDVKEYYFYIDSTPTHSYMKYLYKYPQREYPYRDLRRDQPAAVAGRVRVRAARHRRVRRRPLLRRVRGVCEGGSGRHSDPHHGSQSRARSGPASCAADPVVPQYLVVARAGREACRSPKPAPGAFGPHTRTSASTTLFVRRQPRAALHRERKQRRPSLGQAQCHALRQRCLPRLHRLGHSDAVNPAKAGTKAAAHYILDVPAGGSRTIRLRLAERSVDDAFNEFEAGFAGGLPTLTNSTSGSHRNHSTKISAACTGRRWRGCSGRSSTTTSTSSTGCASTGAIR